MKNIVRMARRQTLHFAVSAMMELTVEGTTTVDHWNTLIKTVLGSYFNKGLINW